LRIKRKLISFILFVLRVTKYAEEVVAYGTNYFLKVFIGDDLYIHIRIHRPKDQDKYDFYALHEIIQHNIATCVFTESKKKKEKKSFIFSILIQLLFFSLFFYSDDPLTYFNH